MSKVKYIIFCFLFFILIKNTETIQPKENNDQNDFPEKDKRFPQRKPGFRSHHEGRGIRRSRCEDPLFPGPRHLQNAKRHRRSHRIRQ